MYVESDSCIDGSCDIDSLGLEALYQKEAELKEAIKLLKECRVDVVHAINDARNGTMAVVRSESTLAQNADIHLDDVSVVETPVTTTTRTTTPTTTSTTMTSTTLAPVAEEEPETGAAYTSDDPAAGNPKTTPAPSSGGGGGYFIGSLSA